VRYINPQWVSLLRLLGMNATYERGEGCELFASDGPELLCAQRWTESLFDHSRAERRRWDHCRNRLIRYLPQRGASPFHRSSKLTSAQKVMVVFRIADANRIVERAMQGR
jgi:hypothetical protein